ncbi:MAG: SpoIID/LytB domain-containing protein [Myxococcota bacterium]|nr:SpoIID/LytB domain-containing protein [Myxococcota bacterium]
MRPTNVLNGALPGCVKTKHGCLRLEEEYIAGVIDCELGGLTNAAAALEAQAIAARTYLASHLSRRGLDQSVRTSARFQCWRRPKRRQSILAAQATAGLLISWRGDLISANYVAGTRKLSNRCTPKPPKSSGYPYERWPALLAARNGSQDVRRGLTGTDWTEIYVTRNEGRRGNLVRHTPIGLNVTYNRGALSQNGAMCLATRRGFETIDILKYYYGEDIQLVIHDGVASQRASTRWSDLAMRTIPMRMSRLSP